MSNGACRVGPRIIRQGQESVLDGTGCVVPGIIRQGRESVSDGTGCAGPGIILRGQIACQTGLVASTPELSVGGPGWLRLWGVAGSPSVDTLSEGDAPLSPKLTVGADGDAVDWNAPRGVTYGRRGVVYLPPAATRSPRVTP